MAGGGTNCSAARDFRTAILINVLHFLIELGYEHGVLKQSLKEWAYEIIH